ncbi:MAG: patatin-like phospholipase family protein [Methylocystis sp.]|nr:patatin-like phospholipase family protein [Methylocystis sp.]
MPLIEPNKTAFVFAGGGSLGAIQVGMLRALLAANVQPDFVIGSSVGAINAGYFAGAPNAEGVARLEDIWRTLKRGDVFPFTLENAFGLFRHPGHIVDPGRLRRLIDANLPYASLEEAAIPVHIAATDVHGMAVRLSSGSAIDAILASAAIPGVFPPVEIDGRMLMDGAVATNTPIRLAAELGAARIVVLPTGYACALKEPPKRAIARILHAITLLIAWQLMRDLERLADETHVCIVPTLCPLDVSPYDFSASRYLIERAADNTRKWLEDGGLARRSLPRELAAHRH